MPAIVTTDTPVPAPILSRGPTHTLSVLVSNEPGVLMRICQVFSRRGFNIDSLVVSEGRNANFSRMTIGISGDPQGLSQIIMQVSKLIDIIHCSEHDDQDAHQDGADEGAQHHQEQAFWGSLARRVGGGGGV